MTEKEKKEAIALINKKCDEIKKMIDQIYKIADELKD